MCYNLPMKQAVDKGVHNIAVNRRSRYDYHLLQRYEAGIVLQGTEVKSLRLGKVSFNESYARVEDNELFLYDLHIAAYDHGNRANHEPKRKRKLLMHKHEISKLASATQAKGFTLVPTRMYFSRGIAKVELALARGKQVGDKREALREQEAQRAIREATRL